MPFALVTIGLILIVVGAKGTQREFGSELRADFTGPGNFTFWIASVGAVGALGYVESLKTFSRAFMALIIVSMILSNRGFFQKFMEALNAGPESIKGKETAASNDNKQSDFLSSVTGLSMSNNAQVNAINAEGSKRIDAAGKRAADIVATAFKAYTGGGF